MMDDTLKIKALRALFGDALTDALLADIGETERKAARDGVAYKAAAPPVADDPMSTALAALTTAVQQARATNPDLTLIDVLNAVAAAIRQGTGGGTGRELGKINDTEARTVAKASVSFHQWLRAGAHQ